MRTRTVCGVSRGDPPLSISWLKDGTPIPSSLDVAQSPLDPYSVLLSISRLRAEHSGEYTCVASNMAASVKLSAVLQVKGGKAGDYQEVRGSGGSSSGRGPQLRLLSNGSLMIQHSREEDEGFYLCQASNGIGAALRKVVQFRVDSAPHFTSHSHQLTVKKGETAVLKCHVAGDSPLSVVWMRGKEVFNPAPAASVVLEPLTPATRYVARVVAQGPAGRSLASPELRFTTQAQRPAGPPLQLSVTPVSSSVLAVSWSPPRSELQHGTISSYNVGFRLASSTGLSYNFTSVAADPEETRGTHLLTGLKKFSRYWVAVQAVNQEGPGPLSEPMAAATLEDIPTRPPLDVRCAALSSQSLQVTWQPPPAVHTHGLLQGYRIVYEPAEFVHDNGPGGVQPESRQTQALTTVLNSLARHANYSVQVAAVTGAGDGPLSRPVFCRTSEDVPARIASFGGHVTQAWRTVVTLACLAVGQPSPDVEWQVENSAGGASSPVTLVLRGSVPSAGQLRMLPDNALRIDSAIREHSGNYSCQARNNDGADRIIYHLTVQVPPSAPVVFATGATTNSISLQWKVGDPGNAPLSGYSLNFRVSHGDWEELEFSRRTTSHVLQ
ncbi:hypothetical protein B566_EDAN014769, partial [Ephemera danica]